MIGGPRVLSPAPAPRRGRALGWLAVIAGAYLLALWYVDRDKQVLSRLAEMALPLCGSAALVLASYVLRYQRWSLVLRAQEHTVRWHDGLLAYVAGFAFTASPGKAGELLRIRYFGRLGVPPRTVLAAFVYERALDLLVITVLALGAAALVPVFGVLAGAVSILVAALCTLACWPRLQRLITRATDRLPGATLRQLLHFLVSGATALRPLMGLRLTLRSALYGTAAWLVTAAAFAWLCHAMGLALPWQYALAIYPLAMLIGALSFMPGGVGTTEAAIVLMLGACGVDMDVALALAIGIRLISLWLAVLVGMLAASVLEARPSH